MSEAVIKEAAPMKELGGTGLRVWAGRVENDYLPELTGDQGRKVYRQMATNDATVGGVLHAIELMIQAVDWRVEPASDDGAAAQDADFVESLLGDMSHSWEDFLSEVLTFLVFGWSYFEIVTKRRIGPDQRAPERHSRFTDGRIGVRRLAPRSQMSLLRWEMPDGSEIAGMTQLLPTGAAEITMPIERCLLFRTKSEMNSPEGRSILRRAYRAWYKLRHIEDYEAVGIERELAGLPVVKVPASLLSSEDTNDKVALEAYKAMARDLRKNDQAGIVIPSDPWMDSEGKPSSMPRVSLELLTTGGQRAIDTSDVVRRYQQDIARSMLADFMMLGSGDKGSFALSKNKTDLFLRGVEAILDQITGTLNRHLIPRLWAWNGLSYDTMPELTRGTVTPEDLQGLGDFLRSLAGAGADLFPDEGLENDLRGKAGLPLKEGSDAL